MQALSACMRHQLVMLSVPDLHTILRFRHDVSLVHATTRGREAALAAALCQRPVIESFKAPGKAVANPKRLTLGLQSWSPHSSAGHLARCLMLHLILYTGMRSVLLSGRHLLTSRSCCRLGDVAGWSSRLSVRRMAQNGTTTDPKNVNIDGAPSTADQVHLASRRSHRLNRQCDA
jgi:hypothetical protein